MGCTLPHHHNKNESEGHMDPSEREGVAETDYRHNGLPTSPVAACVSCSRIHVQIILETIQTTLVIDTVKWEIL